MTGYLRRNAKKELHGLPNFIRAVDTMQEIHRFGFNNKYKRGESPRHAEFVLDFKEPISTEQDKVIKDLMKLYFSEYFYYRLLVTQHLDNHGADCMSNTYLEGVVWIFDTTVDTPIASRSITSNLSEALTQEWLLKNVYSSYVRQAQTKLSKDILDAEVLRMAGERLTEKHQSTTSPLSNNIVCTEPFTIAFKQAAI